MISCSRRWSLPFIIFISLALGGCFIALTHFSHTIVISCTDTWADNLILALTLVFILQIFLSPRILPKHYKLFLTIHAVLILIVFWLGFYPISPLGYSSGRIPVLRGFLVIRPNRSRIIASNEIVSLSQGSVVAIQPIMLAGKFDCNWISANGGQLDLPSTCSIVYVPPNVEYDILRLRIRSSCGLPNAIGQIKVSILP